MSALHITDNQFQDKVLKSDKPVLVDFWAPWCGPCKMAGPVLDALADKYEGKVVIAKINIDENQEYAGQFGVMSIPTVLLFKDGKETNRKIGFAGESGYEEIIQQALQT